MPRRKVIIISLSVIAAVVMLTVEVIVVRAVFFQPTHSSTDESPLTDSQANHISMFARKHDMTVEQVMRWEYVLSQRGLKLDDYDEALTRLGESADKALGYHVVRPTQNLGTRLVSAGELRPAQDSTLTSNEESIVKVLKATGY